MAASDPGTEWKRIITSPANLITNPEAIRAGFIAQAEAKVGRARPFIDRSQELRTALQNLPDIAKLLELSSVRDELITAAGISQKASKYFTNDQLDEAVVRVIGEVYSDCVKAFGANGDAAVHVAFCEEVVARYLLTAGATLDGQMRNWTGAQAQDRLVTALVAALERRGKQPEYVDSAVADDEKPEEAHLRLFVEDDAPEEEPSEEVVPEIKRTRLEWPGRLLLFNVTLKPIAAGKVLALNNIDMVLLRADGTMSEEALRKDATTYLACGELKGGIDPAGADEHWKTARSSLDRIQSKFNEAGVTLPTLFFVGAVIVSRMAGEIYERLTLGNLSYAANLTKAEQLEAFADWLISL